jgi:hypothetical protein
MVVDGWAHRMSQGGFEPLDSWRVHQFHATQRAQWVKKTLGVDLPLGFPEESYPGYIAHWSTRVGNSNVSLVVWLGNLLPGRSCLIKC